MRAKVQNNKSDAPRPLYGAHSAADKQEKRGLEWPGFHGHH
jgi:hypothetical protein